MPDRIAKVRRIVSNDEIGIPIKIQTFSFGYIERIIVKAKEGEGADTYSVKIRADESFESDDSDFIFEAVDIPINEVIDFTSAVMGKVPYQTRLGIMYFEIDVSEDYTFEFTLFVGRER